MTTPVLFFSANSAGRDFVVGDLHGCYSAFRAALHHVNFHPSVDRVFSVGDLIDRGPQSFEALELLHQPWFFACRGNHEQMLLEHLQSPHEVPAHDNVWLRKVYSNFTDRQRFSGQWLPILERLPFVIKVGSGPRAFYVVHGEVLEERATVLPEMVDQWSFSDPVKAKRRALWGRSLLKAYHADRPVRRAHHPQLPLIFCGHSITHQPIQLARQMYLDGGAYLAFDPDKREEMERDFVPTLRLFDVQSHQCWGVHPNTAEVVLVPVEIPRTS